MTFEAVKSQFPYQQFDYSLPRHFETYTGRGKSIIVDAIKKNGFRDLLEIGVFLGASIDFFLNVEVNLRVVGCDPWEGGWAGTHSAANRYNDQYLLDLSSQGVEWLNNGDSFFNIVNNGLINFHERLVLMRQTFETGGPILRDIGYQPDLIFLDATKEMDLLVLSRELFPKALITGDDYRWLDENGEARMAMVVHEFAEKHNMDVEVCLDTWVLHDR